jgi:hypothetical protein
MEVLDDRCVPAADILVNDDAGYNGAASFFTQSETTLVASGDTVVVGFNDTGSANGTNQLTGFAYSTDSGATFTDGGALPANPNGDAGDPVLARDGRTGRIYFATAQRTGSGVDVFHSDDGGVHWSPPAQGAPGKANGAQDKEWIAVDNFTGAGRGNVYLVARDFGTGNGIYLYRSTDGGNTFGPDGGTLITAGQQGAFVTVGPGHEVYAFWYAGDSIRMRKSTDLGRTFGAPVTVASGLVGGITGDLGLTGLRQGTTTYAPFRTNKFPQAAVNPVSGDVYVTFANVGAGGDKADAFLVRSTDGGASFGAPLRVNDDATATDQWFPTLAVTPDGAHLGVFYYSRQEDPVGNNLFKYYGRIADVSGPALTFAPSFAVSGVASLPEFGRDAAVGRTYMGDYNQAVATPSAFHVAWSDNRDNLGVFPPNPIKDPNVYYKTIVVAAPPPTISVNDVTRPEGNRGQTPFVFTVSLSATASGPVTVRFATADGTASSANGHGRDYRSTSGTLTFRPGQTRKTVTVWVTGDIRVEAAETFFVNLSGATGAVIADAQGVGTILNDDHTFAPCLVDGRAPLGAVSGNGFFFAARPIADVGPTPAGRWQSSRIDAGRPASDAAGRLRLAPDGDRAGARDRSGASGRTDAGGWALLPPLDVDAGRPLPPSRRSG